MTSTITATRRAAGVSVKELAERLNVTPSAVSQLERSETDGTIKLNSLREALAALGAGLRVTAGPESPMSLYAPYRVADSMTASLLSDSDPTFPLRLLTHAIKELRSNPPRIDPIELQIAPTPLPDKRWDTLMRAAYAHALPAQNRPAWTRTSTLSEPWYLSEYPALRDRARRNTPEYLRKLNIFVDERSLSRA